MTKKKTAWEKRIDKLQEKQKNLLIQHKQWKVKIQKMKETKEEVILND